MNVLYASNDGYASFLGISLYSLLINNKEDDIINIYILSNGIQNENVLKITNMVNSFHRNVFFIDITNIEGMIGFNINACGYNITTLARLFIDDLLPKEVQKILYLDCDIIVNGNIQGLWNTEISSFLIAATPEVYMPFDKKKNIGLEKSDIYYNAGMLLVNRKLWKEECLKEQFLDYYKEKNGELLYNDQDIINHCCKGRTAIVSPTFNFEPNVYYFPYYYLKKINSSYFKESKDEFKEMVKNPKIIHFLGDERPWVKGNKNPYREIFYYYMEASGWKDINWISDKETYMSIYHILNVTTRICPPIRTLATNLIGINKFKWFGKQ